MHRFRFLAFVVLLLFVLLPNLALAQQDETHGAFTVVFDQDTFTDANRSFIMTIPTDSRSGRLADNLGFSAMCMADGLNIVVLWGKFFGGDRDDRVEVRYRLDDRPSPDPMRWPMFPSSEAAWMPMHQVGGFVAEARTARTLALRVIDPLDGETITNTFSLEGFGAALDRILPCR